MARIRRIIGILLLITAFLVTQIPGSKSSAAASTDFQVDGTTLVKYTGTASSVSIPSGIKKIGAEAFAGNASVTSISFGKDVREIEYGAFKDCIGLVSVALPDSLEIIGSGAFSNNSSLKRVAIKKNLKDLGSGVFAGCSNLTTVSVDKDNPNFIVSDGALYSKDKTALYAYFGGNKATSYTMPQTVTKVVDYAFWGNEALQEIILSSSLREISGYAFSNCKALSRIAIPYSVRSIDTKAFENCTALAEASIPASVVFIHSTAFDGCSSLEIVADKGTNAYDFYQNWKRDNRGRAIETTSPEVADVSSVSDNSSGDNSAPQEGSVYVVGGNNQISTTNRTNSSNANQGTGASADTNQALYHPSNVDYIPQTDPLEGAEDGVVGKTIVVGQSAVVLMDSSLTVNSGLTIRAISQEEEEEAIGSFVDEDKGTALPKYAIIDNKITANAYYGSDRLGDYTLPSNITAIGDFAFARSTIASVSIPEGVREIGYAAFYHCDQLTAVTIPSTVSWIDSSAFSYTAWLNNWGNDKNTGDFLIVGDGVLLAYKGNSQLVEIPAGVKTIAPAVFAGHDEIQGVNIPDSVRIIGEEAFLNCSSLSSLQGGRYLSEIQDRAFQNTALTEITIPDTVETIGVAAFSCEENQGGRTVVFEGNVLPKLGASDRSKRVSNSALRQPAFSGNWTAILTDEGLNKEGTIFEKGSLGFTGKVAVVNGGQRKQIDTLSLENQAGGGIQITSAVEEWPAEQVTASIPYEGSYLLTIQPDSRTNVEEAFKRIYGESVPEMFTFNMTMKDSTDSVELTRFGTRPLEVRVPLPNNISGSEVHVVALDEDGQLELLSSSLVQQVGDGAYVKFSTTHLSSFAIYALGENDSRLIENGNILYTSVSGKKDYSPNTGDSSIHPKWFIALGTGAVAVILIFGRPKRKTRKH